MPSTISWKSGAPAIAQINTWTFATAGSIGDVITVTIGSKSWTYTTTSATISVFLPLFLNAINALASSVYPEFAEITWTNPTASTIIGTSKTAGKPFTATLATNSAGTTINGGASSTGTATLVSSGPYDASTAANWSGGVVPVTGDTVIIDREGTRIYWGLNQSGVVAASRRIVTQDCIIGLPKINTDGPAYPEYRPDYWQMTATLDYLNTASGRIKLNQGTGQTTFTQDMSGSGIETNVPAVLLCGSHASNVWNFFGGQASLQQFQGDAFTANVLRLDAGTTITCGPNAVLNTINNFGGNLLVNGAIVTALNHPGTGAAKTQIEGSGAVAQITLQGGSCIYDTIGTLGGNTVLGNNASLTFDNDQRPKTVTNPISIYSPSVRFSDQFGVISGGYTLSYVNCVGTLRLKPNSSAVIASL